MELALKRYTLLQKKKLNDYFFPAITLLLFIWLQKDYFIPSFQIILAILMAPFVFRVRKSERVSYRYAIAAIVLLLLYYYLTISVLLFVSTGCLVLFSIESRFGRIGLLPFFFLICISPALNYLVNSSTFAIRLELSKYAALFLNAIGHAVENKGTYFVLQDGSRFNVDSACIGLKLFNTGLSIAILLLGFSEQREKKSLRILPMLSIFLITIALLVLTNLLRIIVIVLFKSEAGSVSHDMLGIASLLLYTILPVYFIINYSVKRFGKSFVSETKTPLVTKPSNSVLIIVLCITSILVFTSVKKTLQQTIKDEKLSRLIIPGYTKALKEDGVFEFRNANSLIYIKPANKGYESDHPPTMCWQGSGFRLEEINEKNYNGFNILCATLKRDTIVQYTAWWYDNGSDKTIEQWRWRFSHGEPYRIINITTKTRPALEALCKSYLNQKLF